jgi:Aspartyl protease
MPAVGVLALSLLGACEYFGRDRSPAPASDYVVAAVRELGKGNFDEAEDILLRCRGRFPDDEVTIRWLAELHLMRWRDEAALDLLLELTLADRVTTVSRRELKGQVGDLLFRLGKYGESASYLRSGSAGEAEEQRKAKAFVTLGLPYVRSELEIEPTRIRLFDGIWPAMLCTFDGKDRVCVLDTGSSMSAFAESMAREVGATDVSKFGLISDSLGRKHLASIGIIPNVAFGDIELGATPVLILDDERLSLRELSTGPDKAPMGIIGIDVLSRFRFTLDMSQQLARLDRPRELTDRNSQPCLAVEGCLALPVRVDGVTMWFILDTAASHSSLTKRGLADLPGGDRRATPDYRSLKSLGNSFVSKKVTGVVVQTSAVKFTGIEFPIVDRVSVGVFPVHGVLGVDLLRHCRMTLDGGRILLEQVASLPQTKNGEAPR